MEVPLLMRLFGYQGRFNPRMDGDYYSVESDTGGVISMELVDFWRNKWIYNKALPLRTSLWEYFSGSKDAGVNVHFSALTPTETDVISFLLCKEVDECGDQVEEFAARFGISFDEGWYSNPPGTHTKSVGFLFMVFTAQVEMTSVELMWTEYANPLPIREFSWEELSTDLSKWPDPAHFALTDAVISQSAPLPRSKKISDVKSGQEFIWLLSAYRADENGLPLFYLTDVSKPRMFICMRNGSRIEHQIREPYLSNAARVMVPNGWFGQ